MQIVKETTTIIFEQFITNFYGCETVYFINRSRYKIIHNLILKIMIKVKNVKIDWDYQKDRLKEKFSSLTDRDLNFEKGKMEAMLIKLQDKLGITRHELYTIITKP